MDLNIYYLELIFILGIFFSSRNWCKRTYWQRHDFWRKEARSTRKKLGCKFIRINTSNAKNSYDLDYEIVMYKHLLMSSKIKKKIEKKNKRKRNERESRKRNERKKTKKKKKKN